MRFYQSPAKIGIDHRIKLNSKTFPRSLEMSMTYFFQQILLIQVHGPLKIKTHEMYIL